MSNPTIVSTFDLSRVVPVVPTNLKQYEGVKVDSTDLIGIEVEIENVRHSLGGVNPIWFTKSDGSLRNNGVEFVTSPIEARHAPQVLHHLMTEWLSQSCSFSPRTSVHVHLNMQDFSVAQILDFVLVYSVFERPLYRFAGRGRMRNIYCVPVLDTKYIVGLLEDSLKSEWSKYTGLNLATLRTFGTVEFRHMHGTFDVVKLCRWISMITSIKSYIRESDSNSIREMVSHKVDYPTLSSKIFGGLSEFLKYKTQGELDSSLLTTKLAFLSTAVARSIRLAGSKSSPFLERLN